MNLFQPFAIIPTLTPEQLTTLGVEADDIDVVFSNTYVVKSLLVPLTETFTETHALSIARELNFNGVFIIDANRQLHDVSIIENETDLLGRLVESTPAECANSSLFFIHNGRFFTAASTLRSDV